MRRQFLVALGIALAALAVLPAAAVATFRGQVTSTGVLDVDDLSGATDTFSITDAGANLRVTNPAGGASAGAGCAVVSATVIECPEATIDTIDVFANSGADRVTISGPGFSTVNHTAFPFANSLKGGGGDDHIAGNADVPMPDRIEGGDGNDVLDGEAGDDRLFGNGIGLARFVNQDADVIAGGDGVDSANYQGEVRDEPLRVTIGDGPNDGSAIDGPADARDDVLGDVEEVIGGNGNDFLAGDGSDETLVGFDGADVVVGGDGDDALVGFGGEDRLEGGRGEDDLTGHQSDDVLLGGEGDDALDGATSADLLDGGEGFDVLDGGSSDDVLNGGEDGDELTGRSGEDLITGGEGDDTLTGGTSDDILKGGESCDSLEGGDDADVLNGGAAGCDLVTYAASPGGVTVTIGAGESDDGGATDGISGERDTVRGNVEDLTGSPGNDSLTGSEVNNAFFGGAGADRVAGLAGIDTMSYLDHASGVTVIIDSGDNDGSSEDGPVDARDLIGADVENLVGTSFADSLKGSAAANIIDGRAGADTLLGAGGNDRIAAIDGIADTKINCGGGTADLAFADPGLDPPATGCETVVP